MRIFLQMMINKKYLPKLVPCFVVFLLIFQGCFAINLLSGETPTILAVNENAQILHEQDGWAESALDLILDSYRGKPDSWEELSQALHLVHYCDLLNPSVRDKQGKHVLEVLKSVGNPWQQVEEYIAQISIKSPEQILADFRKDNPLNPSYQRIEHLLPLVKKFYSTYQFNTALPDSAFVKKTLPECNTSEELTSAIKEV